MSNRFLVVVAAAVVLVSGPTRSAAQTATGAPQAVLTPGDSVRITVHRNPEVSGDFLVGADGTVMHPLLRTVKVGGVAFPVAEANLRSYLSTLSANPQFVMEPLFRVAVSGEVIRPQVFAARPETSIAEAVARAGGPTQNARRDQVRVIRAEASGRQREFIVDLLRPERGLASTPIRSGDLIMVERKRSFFRDFMVPALTVAGSIASIGLLIMDRSNN